MGVGFVTVVGSSALNRSGGVDVNGIALVRGSRLFWI